MNINKNDFYNWAFSDLLMNNQRGHLAEFVVAKALNITDEKRAEWEPYDLNYNGIKIEIKSSAYIQSWEQSYFSKIIFGIRPTRKYGEDGKREDVFIRQSDIYVFCVLKHKDRETIDPLKTEQWEFYVVPTSTINEKLNNQKSICLSQLILLSGSPVSFDDIKKTVDKLIK